VSGQGWRLSVAASFPDTVVAVRAALAKEGFGILTEIDVQATLREKLGEAMEDYLILGACNPTLAHQALTIDRSVGQLLPCTVVIRGSQVANETLVEAQDPTVMVALTGSPDLQPIADEAAARLGRALAELPVATTPAG
jgi:uncharacterized protein (DUF302 family)